MIQRIDKPMRITLEIDDDVLAAATYLAEREQSTVGEIVSALTRQGLAHSPSSRGTSAQRNGVPLLPGRGVDTPVTTELVNQLRDETP